MSKIESRDELSIILGGMDKHIKFNDNGKENHGGKLVNELLSTQDYVLLNNTNKTTGGPYTRYSPEDPDDESKKSMLDLVIVSKELYQYVDKMVIDNQLKWTPGRSVSKTKISHTDYYAIVVVFKDIPVNKVKIEKRKKTIIWNTNKKVHGKNTTRELILMWNLIMQLIHQVEM